MSLSKLICALFCNAFCLAIPFPISFSSSHVSPLSTIAGFSGYDNFSILFFTTSEIGKRLSVSPSAVITLRVELYSVEFKLLDFFKLSVVRLVAIFFNLLFKIEKR